VTTGVIANEPTPDWRGTTLTVDATTGATTLTVDETIDLDDDTTRTRWLVVGESEPLEYVDFSSTTVTLAEETLEDYEAGLPVVLWDPTAGAKVIEYLAPVRLSDGSGTVDAVIPHELIPLNGVANLVGASVSLTEDGGEWYIGQVFARTAVVNSTSIDTPYARAYLGSTITIATAVNRLLSGWTVAESSGIELVDGVLTDSAFAVTSPGAYLVIGTVAYESDGSGNGARNAYLTTFEADDPTVTTTVGEVAYGTGSGGAAQIQVQGLVIVTDPASTRIALTARQTSGIDLDVEASGAVGTRIEIVRIA
jgi:hypothetical protein